jgi:PAS domain S-box-containing protein
VTGPHEDTGRALRWAEATDTPLVCFDREYRFVYVNAAAERLLDTSREELLGRTQWALFPPTVGTELEQAYRHAMTAGEPVRFEQYHPDHDRWYRMDVRPVGDGLDVTFGDVTAGRRVRRADQPGSPAEAPELLDLLTETSVALSATLDVGEAVQRLARLVVPRLADWCIVSALDAGTGQLRDVAVVHGDPARQLAAERYARSRAAGLSAESPARRALATRRVVTTGSGRVEDVEALVTRLVTGPAARRRLAALAPGGVAAVPLLSGGRVVGLLSLCRDAGHPLWTERELRAATDVAGRAGTALENARLFTQQVRLAEGLQRSLLTDPPEPDHSEIVVRYLPAAEAARVGGDWYDAFIQPGGTAMIVIGDVVGHDTEAAAAMGQLRSLLRGIATYSDAGPAEVLAGLDRSMAVLGLRTLATAAVARFEQDDDEHGRGVTRVRWSNAGHPPPLAVTPDGQVIVLAASRAELLLGVEPATVRTETVATLDRGSTVFFYTDGLVERRDSDLDDGLERLRSALQDTHGLPLGQLCDDVVQRLVDGRPEDDVALVAVRLHRQDRPRPAEAGPNRVPDPVPDEPAD